MPVASSLGLQLPELPGPINNAEAQLTENLNFRKQHLHEYLTKVLVQLSSRAPVCLLVFLDIHEQSALNFAKLNSLQKLSEVNLTKSLVTINQSDIIVNSRGAAKTHYFVKLEYKPFPSVKEQDLLQSL